ncbi:hypothetical protein GALMADRAFT_224321 [Galerina marginata CBS 339.88]|uniref:J domain-containing protein n=1 Tax=Galerina marginata (strain CBS 339.88) TaxID=685588 RepID=A0A067TFX2_GALM3|nr:hypothetical protein GALMADRAFT_224321 [Galerina marginata CBS 339.88]
MGASESTLKASLNFDNLDLYEVLGISEEAFNDEVKRAYCQRALETHPGENIDDVDGATGRFARVLEAYETLSDPSSRSAYDCERENQPASESPQQPSEAESMPGYWERDSRGTRASSSGWLEWLFSGWIEKVPSGPLSGYIPEEYIARNTYHERPRGISARDICDYENGRDQSRFAFLRNLFECLAYDELKWGNEAARQIAHFGCGNSGCPDDDQHAQHYAQDFYEFWLNFKTEKTFEWINRCRARVGSEYHPGVLRKVAQLNHKDQKAFQEQYDKTIQDIVGELLRYDPRFLFHIYTRYYSKGNTPGNNFYHNFVQRMRTRPRANRFAPSSHAQAPENASTKKKTRTQTKKQTQRNKAKQKKSW